MPRNDYFVVTKCEPSMFHCHRRAAEGGFLSLLLAVLMVGVVAEMRSRWPSRAVAAACPDLFSRQAAQKKKKKTAEKSLSFSLYDTREIRDCAVDLSTWRSCWRSCSLGVRGIGLGVESASCWGLWRWRRL